MKRLSWLFSRNSWVAKESDRRGPILGMRNISTSPILATSKTLVFWRLAAIAPFAWPRLLHASGAKTCH